MGQTYCYKSKFQDDHEGIRNENLVGFLTQSCQPSHFVRAVDRGKMMWRTELLLLLEIRDVFKLSMCCKSLYRLVDSNRYNKKENSNHLGSLIMRQYPMIKSMRPVRYISDI